ncbi:MAG: AMP-binding protein [Acidobacteriota bacterium]|nr:AMP-binding protein [Acidobacteriota bacterium]
MPRETLIDFFQDRIRSDETFLVYDGGYRTHRYSYNDVRCAAIHLADRFTSTGLSAGDKVILWGDNRAEWIVAFWGCLLARVICVPIDFRASPKFLERVASLVTAHIIIADKSLNTDNLTSVDVWPLETLLSKDSTASKRQLAIESEPTSRDLAEIIFTSGATSEPKGVEITHGNVLANIVPVEQEITKYLKYGRPFLPLRFLNLLPLSHMFGQAMATFIPPMLNSITVFMRGFNPTDIARQIRTQRVSVLVCVPKILDVLRKYVETHIPETREPAAQNEHVAKRWWRYRKVHRLFGCKFWAFVVGAAPLSQDLERFWSKLGFLVIQGYGLTETAPIVTLNHPFRTRQGSVGSPIGGVEIKIAEDGEILVKGGNVTSGYYNAPKETASAFEDGWFHTGDIGSLDSDGRLSVRGRKKEMIVTPEGLNVFPEDIERAVHGRPGVRDVAIVSDNLGGEERVHAVLLLEDNADPGAIIRNANAVLEDHQRIRKYTVWTESSLPRTEGTQKLKRQALKQWVQGNVSHGTQQPSDSDTSVDMVFTKFAGDRKLSDATTLNEIGLSSIERIELMLALEQVSEQSVDENLFDGLTTIGTLKTALQSPQLETTAQKQTYSLTTADPIAFPTWSQSPLARSFRSMALSAFLLPLTRLFAWLTVDGTDHIKSTSGPVLFAANHQSHLDAPVILNALPRNRRHTVATATALEWFSAHFYPVRFSWWARTRSNLSYYLTALCFNIVPLPQRETGTRDAMRYLGTLLSDGSSVLIFPEGRRSKTTTINQFRPGVGMLAAQLEVPVIPVRIKGINKIWPEGRRMPRVGRARVTFGPAMRFSGSDYEEIAQQIENAVKAL